MKPLPYIRLNQLYDMINEHLKGSVIINEDVKIQARVKLPDEPKRIVDLKVMGVSIAKVKIPEEERVKMGGMYPPTERATIYIDCETMPEEANVDKGS